MKLGVISDTHDRLDTLEKAVKQLAEKKIEAIVHCGDWVSPFTLEFFDQTCQKHNLKVPVYSVLGNNDGGDLLRFIERNQTLVNPIKFSSKPSYPLELGSKKIIVYHGHDTNLLNGLIESGEYDVVFHGHTHVPRNEVIGKTLVFNPGSTAKARQSMFVDEVSIGVYDTDTGEGEIVYLERERER